jgi:arsenite-transporting ATPase
MQEVRFKAALDALSNPALTTVVLVTRPEKGAIAEASRTSEELKTLGLGNQWLVMNGVFRATDQSDAVANAMEALGQQEIAAMPQNLRALGQDQVPLRSFDTVGLPALRALLNPRAPAASGAPSALPQMKDVMGLDALVEELVRSGHGLIMVMGKGGVGKTTIAAALALGLVLRGKSVHLSTTDPASHLASTLNGAVEGLRVEPHRSGRRDPALCRQDHGNQGSRIGRTGARTDAGRPAFSVHRGGRGIPRVLAHRQ